MGARDYSTTAASNLSVGGISLAEGMARSSVNNAMRQQLAEIADLLLDLGGATATTGSATAYLVGLPTAPSAYSNNLLFLATSHVTNTGAATINVSGGGVKDIEKIDSGAAVPLVAGDFPAGHIGIFTYSSTSNSFILLNAATAGLAGSGFGIFAILSDAVAASVPSTVDMLMTLSYATAGDGGGAVWVRRGSSAPTHAGKFQSADGDWWEINSNKLDVRMFGAIGDGTTAADTAFFNADDAATSQGGKEIYVNEDYKINANLALSSLLVFGPGGQLKPASGVTVLLGAGFTATPTQHCFDISLGGDVWPTVDCPVTARNYGAAGDDAGPDNPTPTNDRLAFQHLIDCRLYFQKARRVELDGGKFFISGGPLIVNYGDVFRGIDMVGAGYSYDYTDKFPGTYLRSDYYGNLLEVHGARGMTISGIGFEGPFHHYIRDQNFCNYPPPTPDGDPLDHTSWLPNEGNEAGALLRFKMNCAIHVDPRGGTKPVAVHRTDVLLVITDRVLTPANSEAGHVLQGTTLAAGNRILNAVSIDVDGWPGRTSNGVFVVQAAGTGAMVRPSDFDVPGDFPNCYVHCTGGDYAGTDWICNNAALNAIDTPSSGFGYNIDFRQFDGVIAYEDYAYPAWTGIATQYGKLLSSFVTVRNCGFMGFGCALAVKGCDDDGNADFVRMEYCGGQYNVYGMAWGQTQARDQGMIACQWSQSRVCVSTSVIGRQNGKAHFDALNSEFSGSVDILDIPTMSIAGGVSLQTCYAESGFRVGRVTSTGLSSGFTIAGGHYGFDAHPWNGRVPRWIIDCRGAGVVISPATVFGSLYCPLIIYGNPAICHVDARITNPLWMSATPGTSPAGSIAKSDAILLNSTMGVLFINIRQGPWTGGGSNTVWTFTTASGTATYPGTRQFGSHVTSDVTAPIPFCAKTTGPAQVSGFDTIADPMPVALGGYGIEAPLGNASYFTAPPSQSGRTLTLQLAAGLVSSLGTRQNLGLVPGSVLCDPDTGSLFVVATLSGTTMTAKLLNNYDLDTLDPLSPIAAPSNLYFVPTGHYTPHAGVELTWVGGTNTVGTQTPDTGTDYTSQFPAGAAKMVNDSTDALTPILRTNSGVTSVVDGTITMAGNARAAPAGTKRERAGIWFVPR